MCGKTTNEYDIRDADRIRDERSRTAGVDQVCARQWITLPAAGRRTRRGWMDGSAARAATGPSGVCLKERRRKLTDIDYECTTTYEFQRYFLDRSNFIEQI